MWKSLLQRLFGQSEEHPLSKKSAPAPLGQQVSEILSLSEREAQRLHHTNVQSDDMLLALLKSDSGLARRALNALGVDATTVETQLLVWSPLLEPPPSDEIKMVLAKAQDEAHYFKSKHISTEHILLALTHFENSAACRILQQFNVTPKLLREKVYALVESERMLDNPPPQTNAKKVERFTKRARLVLSISQQIAEERHDRIIGVEYLLIALLREEGGVAGRTLLQLGITTEKLEPVLYAQMNLIAAENKPPDLSADIKRTLEMAVDEARRRGHHYIGTEHLLMGLMRQKNLLPVKVLSQLGITPEMVLTKMKKILSERPPSL